MNISAPFINRPVATTLLMIALAFAGMAAFPLLPVAPLPKVDFPTINISASLPWASPRALARPKATALIVVNTPLRARARPTPPR